MTSPFFAASFAASRADALIAQVQMGLAQAPVGTNMAVVLADEACGQALIDRVVSWLSQEIGGPVLAIPTLGHDDTGQAQIQVLAGCWHWLPPSRV